MRETCIDNKKRSFTHIRMIQCDSCGEIVTSDRNPSSYIKRQPQIDHICAGDGVMPMTNHVANIGKYRSLPQCFEALGLAASETRCKNGKPRGGFRDRNQDVDLVTWAESLYKQLQIKYHPDIHPPAKRPACEARLKNASVALAQVKKIAATTRWRPPKTRACKT